MKNIVTALFTGGLLLGVTSCSCGIYRDEFVSANRRRDLTDQLAERAAIMSGFSVALPEDGYARFTKDEVELVYEHEDQRIIVRSSLCPWDAALRDPEEWQSHCESVSSKLAIAFKDMGVPLRKLSSDEQIQIQRGEKH